MSLAPGIGIHQYEHNHQSALDRQTSDNLSPLEFLMVLPDDSCLRFLNLNLDVTLFLYIACLSGDPLGGF